MIACLHRQLRKVIATAVVILVAILFSAWHARKSSDTTIQGEVAPPPYYSTRFVLYPGDYVDGASRLGFRPGWVVTYASKSRLFGTAFFVSVLGEMLARGTPSIVTAERRKHDDAVAKFTKAMAKVYASISMGMQRSKLIALLGHPIDSETNSGPDGKWTIDRFVFQPRVHFYPLLTNGFTIICSNDAVIQKDPITGDEL